MNILFLSLGNFDDIYKKGIYTDLLRKCIKEGHNVYIVAAREKRTNKETEYSGENRTHILNVRVGNITKTNIIEKGISTLLIEKQFLPAIKRYYSGVRFDLVLYATPPITFEKVIEYIKNRDKARTYLMLKDIFPQNAVDLGMFSKKGLIYKYFRKKEKKLYSISDYIGCMSEANVDYVLEHNREIDPAKVEVCPNSVEVEECNISDEDRLCIRLKYGIPIDKKIFVYGGNLGKPQGIDFLIKCLKSQSDNRDAYFLIIGSGTEYKRLENYYGSSGQKNLKIMSSLPKIDYELLVKACDIGMIFLDRRFTIPNFPSRLLSYMQAKLPVLAVTDANTDVGKVITQGGFGWWCQSGDIEAFNKVILNVMNSKLSDMGSNSYQYFLNNYTVDNAYKAIMEHFV